LRSERRFPKARGTVEVETLARQYRLPAIGTPRLLPNAEIENVLGIAGYGPPTNNDRPTLPPSFISDVELVIS
jgi:hypothetical protein